MAEQLTVPQAFALLLTEPDGRRAVDASRFDAGLAGAVLADLALRGAVSLDGKLVRVVNGAPVGNGVLDAVVGTIAASGTPRKAKWWVSKLGGRQLRDDVAAELVQAGLLTEQQRKTFGIFPSTAYPERDGRPEMALRTTVLEVLDGRTTPTPFTAATIALLDATGSLRQQFGKVDKARVQDITLGTWASPAVKAVLQDIQTTAAMAGVLAATTAATVASS
ncbi:GPP34 family phosphoprotein [Curtobacterium sp. VKM Ac-2922]|uniref:GOLPH3/VPS74 family protein n=1 Tax=Curtobacterium sp. VKM Ac-2922 TaxID=2929475 RepID=UPI001FB2D6BA|nr:GPP34 family phosphoprotein [Curtobacterium sp. VKM Ac-2922]MCJ1715397.1 GPP34 family phosphoprotein [Curtobacterium sp. VKM Ac-2922]